ncbi:insulinase family protein [Neolewinella aurantiaca]|uniref:Insulinase family protein n=1 Tax=Neolewinella aurantiaca TaxID=2602767 RepID=A0A5C7FWA4_9BACT|nr:pitrilysin family protein [Neolewinella aurantiaca]TXF89154.1 insulinase family protein [Neolewinella aurantiaca]
MLPRFIALLLLFSLFACNADQSNTSTTTGKFSVPYEKFELDNGLDVVLHVDKSDPVVAVALTAHVGSAREKEGRTGFAHLFEHLLFLESENLGKGGLDAMSARIGGSGANGSTNRDRTNYFQTVPKDALEKMIWAEADKLGWFINTVTEPVLAKEKQVVKNEKRQSYDNRPYGHNSYVIDKALYPNDHPYNWQVIGSLEDLDNATLADVKEFFRRWYVPNNVTLTIAGDFDPAQARTWVEKYFGEISAGEEVKNMAVRRGQLSETVKLYHEDNFARLPQLTMVWPTVEQYSEDAYALDVLTDFLAYGKEAPFNTVLVDEKKLAPNVRMFNSTSELAGEAQLTIRAFPGTSLDSVMAGVEAAFARFETNGISDTDLNRIKAGQETRFYNGLSSVLGKGFQLAQYNMFAGDPGYVEKDIDNILSVSAADVKRVYETYIKGRPFVATSFVPKGEKALALSGSEKAEVVEEKIETGAEEEFDASVAAEYEPTPSTFDRSSEPPYGEAPEITPPTVWQTTLDNGIGVYGIENGEVPLVNFNLTIPGGQLQESLEKPGVANMLAELMTKGTKNKTTAELEAAIQQLGARINVYSSTESFVIYGNTLARNYPATMALLTEILLEPRWDAEELETIRRETLSDLEQEAASPNAIASAEWNKLLYGDDNIRAYNELGTPTSIPAITMDDLKSYYSNYLSPSIAKMNVVGALDQSAVTAPLDKLVEAWPAKEVTVKQWPVPAPPATAKVYFYDVPGAKQSVLRIGKPAPTVADADYYPATVMNYILGGGGFASRLTQELRESKGYTYGIRSGFSGSKEVGEFQIGSGVRSNVTLESAQAVKEILEDYPATFSEKDLETTRSFLTKSNARAFETAGAKLNMLGNMSEYGWDANYVKDREAIVRGMSQKKIKQLAEQYLKPGEMIWLIVGDAKTQLPRMKELGYGEPVRLN